VPATNLAARVMAALVLIPVALGAGYYGGWALAALLSAAAALSAWELSRIARAAGTEPFSAAATALAGLAPLAVHAHVLGLRSAAPPDLGEGVGGAAAGALHLLTRVFTLSWPGAAMIVLLILTAAIWRRGVRRRPLEAAAVTVLAIIYTGGMLSFGYALRYHPYTIAAERTPGAVLLFFPLLLTWTTDTGAYFVGRSIGRRKLIPSVSPGKSVEGAVGGLLLAVAVAWGYERLVLGPYAHLRFMPGAALLFGAVISVAAQVGDLAESLLKREGGVKDSSHIIPGHGGVLDRLDSLLFVLPTAFWMLGVLRLVPVPH
jgi:phosphatidate cytidylyltransferase